MDGFRNKLDTVKKELVHMRTGQNKAFQMKYKEKKEWKERKDNRMKMSNMFNWSLQYKRMGQKQYLMR